MIQGYFHSLCSTLYEASECPCSYHLHKFEKTTFKQWWQFHGVLHGWCMYWSVCVMLHMIYHTDVLPSIAFPSVSVQTGKHLLVCESSVWIMTPWAECLFTVPQKNANLKKAKWRTARFLVSTVWRVAGGGNTHTLTHTERRGLIRKVICTESEKYSW